MKKWNGYQKGINLGGWLSQAELTKEHCDTFITKADIENISKIGFDHVRLPIDYELVQDENGSFIEEGFSYIKSCIDWCGEYGLNMVLDLHKTAGFVFDNENETSFFRSEPLIERFIALWSEFASRYGCHSDRLAFELLNEVVNECDNAPWMEIAERTVAEIRKSASDIKILIGSYMNNSVLTVKHIAQPFDENIVYNFHCYDPLLFTHQGAFWIKNMPLDYRIPYPMGKAEFIAASAANPANIIPHADDIPENGFSAEYFENIFREAIEVAEERGVMLYCGEYGVIEQTDPQSALNWYNDIHSVLDKYGIGRAMWSYKSMNFGFIDGPLNVISDKIV
jgi:aryl-phospho-beta-D-glucosidase BglC (GH1 family)